MKNKKITVGVVVAIGVAIFFSVYHNKSGTYKDATYTIEGQKVTLKNGTAGTVKYFGNEASYDFDEDGRIDTAFLLTDQPGGSGTFYYLVVGLNTQNGFVGSEAEFIGDRIAPQTTEVKAGNIVIVNYADRAPGESFVTAPSIGKSLKVLFDPETAKFEVLQ